MMRKRIQKLLGKKFSRKYLRKNLPRDVSQLSGPLNIYPVELNRMLRYWTSTRARHSLVPADRPRFWQKILGLKKGEKVLFPASFSGEWAHLVERIVGKGNVVALDFSRVQLGRASTHHKVLGLLQELPFKNKSFDKVVTFEPTPLLSVEKNPLSYYYTALPTLNELHRVGKKVIIIGRKPLLNIRALKEYAFQTGASYGYRILPFYSQKYGAIVLPTNKYAASRRPLVVFKLWSGDYRKQKELADLLKGVVKTSKK